MARAKRKGSAKKGTVKVNFKDVESRTRVNKEGDYPLRCIEAVSGESSNKNDQIEFTFEVTKGEFKGAKAWFYCPLTENSLWKLHALLTAMGVEVPDDEMDIDLSELVDTEIVGVFTPDTYNGKRSFKMTDFCSIDDYEGEDDEDDKKSKGKKGKKSKDDGDEDEKPSKGKKGSKSKKEPEKLSKSDVEDMDRDELEELIDEHDLDVDPKDKKLKKDPALLAAVLEALEEEDLLEEEKKSKGKGKSNKDEDDDEDEPKGKKGKSSKKKAKKKTYDRDDVEDMDEDELQEIIDDNELDVDLDDYKNLKKKVAAVIEALDEEDLLDD